MKALFLNKIFTLIVILTIISGCSVIAPKQSIEDMTILRELRTQAATHKFNSTDKKGIEKAIFEVFNLLDGDDVKVDLRSNKMLLSRSWMYYAVISGGMGRDFWEFKFEEESNGIEVIAAFEAEAHHGILAIPASTDFKDNISIGGNASSGASVADYDLLYSRVEYILGTNNTWPTCNEIATKHDVSQQSMVLCDGIGIEDTHPD